MSGKWKRKCKEQRQEVRAEVVLKLFHGKRCWLDERKENDLRFRFYFSGFDEIFSSGVCV